MEKQAAPDKRHPHQPLRVLIGRLIDGTGASATQNVLMTIEGGRITEMRPLFHGEEFPKDLGHNLSGHTVMPPLVDCHVHMAFSGSRERNPHATRQTPEFESFEPTISRHIRDCLKHGVLGVRDGGDPSAYTLRYKLTALKPEETGFRLNAAGSAWYREGRYGRLIGRAVRAGEDPVAAIEEGTRPEVDHIKLIQSGLNSLTDFGKQTPPQFDENIIRRIYAFARKRGVGLMIHANGEASVAAAIAGGCDSIEHGYFMGDENLRKMADARIAWVPTAVPMKAYADHLPKDGVEYDVARRTLDHQLAQMSKARDYGVTVALGTDSGSPGVLHGKAVPEELKLFMTAGYTLEEAVSCATMNAARLLKTDLSWQFAAGAPATFIAVKGEGENFLETRGVEMVMVEGRVETTSA